jgi:N-acetylglucosaminyldiphosphoundecaprenol N-acetyl-beta-D-mannosaminyltransferase
MLNLPQKVNVLGVKISKLSLNDFLGRLDQLATAKSKAVIQYANVHVLNMACQNHWLRGFYNDCEIVFCDGHGVKLAAEFLGSTLPERFTPPDWLPLWVARCIETERTLFFLGGREGIADKAAQVLIERHTGLRVVGTHHGFFAKQQDGQENQDVVELINRANPDVLVLGFGTPTQEEWIAENRAQLQVGLILVVGAMFDYIAGRVPRGPRWLTDHGFEWLSRLFFEPGRLWNRYLIGIPLFFIRVFRQRLGMLKV